MRRIPAILALSALAACASGGTGGGVTAQPETMRVTGQGGMPMGSISMATGNAASVSKVPFSIDQVWRVMPSVYDSLKIPPTTITPAKHLFANEGMKIRQKLGNVKLSTYIDCGQAQIGPSADSYDIFLTVTTTLRAVSPAETEISTLVESAAKPLAFGQDYSRCTSKGSIENAIVAIATAKAAK